MQITNKASHRPGTAAYTKGQDTIARILDAAFQLAVDEGFEKVTIRRIARELAAAPTAAVYGRMGAHTGWGDAHELPRLKKHQGRHPWGDGYGRKYLCRD